MAYALDITCKEIFCDVSYLKNKLGDEEVTKRKSPLEKEVGQWQCFSNKDILTNDKRKLIFELEGILNMCCGNLLVCI